MKTFASYAQMSKEYFDNWTKRHPAFSPLLNNHPREDYHLLSDKFPIFVVADGVTLKRDVRGNYPVPSGAFELAKKFCETVIVEAEKRYDSFAELDLKKIFETGNSVAKDFNESLGRTKETIDYREFDLFSLTTAFALIKGDNVYWWSLCDSGIVIFNAEGGQKFQSPEAWPDENEKIAATGDKPLSDTEFNKLKKMLFRNILDEDGDRYGYGVVTGEEEAVAYLNYGTVHLEKDDCVFVYSDGYEDYLKLPAFVNYFMNWPVDLSDRLTEYMEGKNIEDVKYGRERSLIAIRY